MTTLGRLTRIASLRNVWPGEETHFTPWLARPENLAVLAETLGYGPDGLAVVGVEVALPGGSHHADILCREVGGPEGELVLIENQFGRSDHDHLGKLLTYASGLRARTVILLAETLRPEHRAALDWLNAISTETYSFIACEVELWRIGDSPPAPRFNVVVRPNDWERSVSRLTGDGAGLSDLRQLYVRYWSAFGERMRAAGAPLRPRKPLPQQWTGFSIGRSGLELNAFVNAAARWVRAELTLGGEDGKAYFALLRAARDEIDAEVGAVLDWDLQPDRKQSRIAQTLDPADPTSEGDWPRQHAWLVDRLTALDRALRHRIAAVDRDAAKLV